jgi:hypothetical protein
MTEQQYGGDPLAQLKARISSPEFRQAMRDSGVTTAQAAERLKEAAQRWDRDGFDALLRAHRPDLWKRMNRQPRPSIRQRILSLVGR